MGMCRERGSYWLVLLSQSAVTPHSETCISLRNTMSRSDQEMQTHPLCRTSPHFGAGRQGRHWRRAGSSWRNEREGNHQPFLPSGSVGPTEGVEACGWRHGLLGSVRVCPKPQVWQLGSSLLHFMSISKKIYQVFPSVSFLSSQQDCGQVTVFCVRMESCFRAC